MDYVGILNNYKIYLEKRGTVLDNKIHIGRVEKKMTQQQLADAVGVSRQTIVALEKNKYNPSLILAFKISDALGKEITSIFEYKEEL